MTDNERARIRSIMYEPSTVWLATEHSGDRWLTDQFVMLRITGAEVLYCYDTSYDVQWEDGAYQLMANGQWRMKDRDSIPEPDIEAYLKIQDSKPWYYATPSEWSVAEHPGKAMLWVHGGIPCLLGESTWAAIKRHYSEVTVEYAPEGNLFRFRSEGATFCYAAGIRIPSGQGDVAYEIARALS